MSIKKTAVAEASVTAVFRSSNRIFPYLIISNKTEKIPTFVTYVKQKAYLCEKFYSYETEDTGKERIFDYP